MAKRLWCILLTAVMLLNLLPVGMADNEGLEEPLPATVEIQPEEEAAEEPIPYEAEPQPEKEAAEEPQPEEEAAEKLLPDEEETESTEEAAEEPLPEEEGIDLLTDGVIPEDEELSENAELTAANEQEENSLGFYLDYDEGAQRFVQKAIPDNAIRLSSIGQFNDIVEIGTYHASTCYVLDCNYIHGTTSLYIRGDVSLILMDGCRMEVYAVRVDHLGSIRIYSQANGTGTLIADNSLRWHDQGTPGCAGIGASGFGVDENIYNYNAGDVYIYGGKITAKGGAGAAGIGGSGRNLDQNASAGNITIRGGEIEAIGGTGWSGGVGAGIGGGSEGNAKNITISGGTVHARSIQSPSISWEGSAAIGCGGTENFGGYFDNITISDGVITAETSGTGAAIGGGYKTSRGARNIIITGGHITANADVGKRGYAEECSAAIGAGYQSTGINISISGSNTEITAIGAGNAAIGNPDRTANITIAGNLQCFAGGNINDLMYFPNSVNAASTNKAVKLLPPNSDEIVYTDAEGSNQIHRGYYELTDKTSPDMLCNWNPRYNPTKWYAVKGRLDIPKSLHISEGDITLVLADGCELNVPEGLSVGRNASLTIYGQAAQSGKLISVVKDSGLGAFFVDDRATVTINGGKITLHASQDFQSAINIHYGKLILNRGEITAGSTSRSGAIGSLAGTFTMNGGKLTAHSQNDSVITLNEATLTINGGEVSASSSSSPVISTYQDGNITISSKLRCLAGSSIDNLTLSSDPVQALCTNKAAKLLPLASPEKIAYSDENGRERSHPGYCELTAGLSRDQLRYWNAQINPTKWYAVKGQLDIPNVIEVEGDISLVLEDGCELSISGLTVKENASLTIYAQTAQSGKLITSGTAFIDGTALTINGGIITANNCSFYIYKKMTINRGEITTTCDLDQFYIRPKAAFTMNGGKLSASCSRSSSVIRIERGTFTMNGGELSASCSDSPVIRMGGTVTMNGGKFSASCSGASVINIEAHDIAFIMNGGEFSASSSSSPVIYNDDRDADIIVKRNIQCYAGNDLDNLTHRSDPVNALYTYKAARLLSPGAHRHSFRCTASGNQITAVCQTADCPLPKAGVRLTLNVPANLRYDGSVKEVTFMDGEAQTWEAATGKDAPRITYTADRGSALTGGKPVNAGSYTASIAVNSRRASVRFTITKVDYTDVKKEASGEMEATNGSRKTITLPALPRGARYGTPVKTRRNDRYTLSSISASRITVTSTGIPAGVNAVSFTVPVIPDGNHNGYTITVTMNVLQPKIKVSVKITQPRFEILPRVRVRGYLATITAGYAEPSAQPLRVEYSLLGQLYIVGNQIPSLLPIHRFNIRVRDSALNYHYYEYRNGQVIER